MASYFDSKKGRRKLAYQGYSYLKHTDGSAGSGLVLWRCDAYQRLGCSGRARVHDDTEVVLTAPHSHPPAPAPQLIRSKAVLADIRRRARGAKAGAQRQSLGPAGMFAPAATVANPALLDEATRPRFNNRFLQGEDGEAGRGYGGHVQKEELDDGEEQPPFGMMDVSLSGEGFPKEAAISASFSDRQQNDAYEMHQLNLMNGSTSNQLQQQQQVSTLLDVEPFALNASSVYKSLREAGRQAEAFALKRKFNQLADQYESMLYQ